MLVGDPIPVADLLVAARRQGWSEDALHTAIASRVSRHLRALKTRLDAGEGRDPGPVSEDEGCSSSSPHPSVSGLDHFDVSDLRWEHQASMWEKAKFRMQHQAWRLSGAETLPSPPSMSAQQQQQQQGVGSDCSILSQHNSIGHSLSQRLAVGRGGLLDLTRRRLWDAFGLGLMAPGTDVRASPLPWQRGDKASSEGAFWAAAGPGDSQPGSAELQGSSQWGNVYREEGMARIFAVV